MKTLSQQLNEVYGHYPKAIEGMVDHLKRERYQAAMIGENTDDTLTRVYKQAGYIEALNDVLSWFRDLK